MWLAQVHSFGDVIDKLDGEELVAPVILLIIFGGVVAVIGVISICSTIRSISVARINRRMIESLADRGFNAAEIQQLVDTSNSPYDESAQQRLQKPAPPGAKSLAYHNVPAAKPIVKPQT